MYINYKMSQKYFRTIDSSVDLYHPGEERQISKKDLYLWFVIYNIYNQNLGGWQGNPVPCLWSSVIALLELWKIIFAFFFSHIYVKSLWNYYEIIMKLLLKRIFEFFLSHIFADMEFVKDFTPLDFQVKKFYTGNFT